MAGNNQCIDLRLKTECTKQLDLTPDPETPWMAEQKEGKILVLCPQEVVVAQTNDDTGDTNE